MKHSYKLRKSKLMLAMLFALFAVGLSPAWGQKSLPYSYGFEDYNLATDGWTKYFGTTLSGNNSECAIVGEAKKTGSYGFRFSSYKNSGANAQYLISPELNGSNGVIVSFAWRVSHGQYSESFKVGYSTTDTDVSSFTWDEGTTSNSTGWKTYENTFPAGTKYVAIYYYSNYCGRLYVDDFSFTAPLSGPALTVTDYDTHQMLTSPANYNFGLATAGTTHYFLLNNPGTQDLGVTLSKTGNFGATLSTTTVPAGGASNVALTVTMPDASGSSEITITPEAGSGIDPFVINVSGTIRDASKLYEDDFSALPDDWTTTGSWYYNSTNGAYTTSWYLSSNARLITPKLTIEDGETFFVEAKGYSTSNTSYQHLQMQYSADGTTWTNFDSEPALDPSNWQTFAFTGVPAGQYYIAINASQADVRMFYGGELPDEAKMEVTEPASLDYGVISTATDKTFTIANTGTATLEGINVTSSNPLFTISGAPTNLAAGESAEVTITMDATTTGALSSDITVSATGMTDVVFTVTGVVLPDGLFVVDFNDNQLPAGWGNNASNKWSFSDGKAYCTSAAELTTPALQFSDGDLLAIKITSYDDYDNNYIEITGSTDGSTWDAFTTKKYVSRSQIPYGSYATLVVTDIPTTVKYLKFKGYYVRVDEIAGLTYAPVLSVTLGSLDCTSPENLNFGECAADASATYNFANTGAGTINITNVAITGDGAAAYSTNWTTSVATPFDLTITRTYDATKAGAAQDAVVTVTTTVGDFVINVTGTDKAANAPELVVSTNAIDFGGVTADAVETVTVTNNGTGSMTVDIVSDSEDFVVSTAQLTEIGAGESKTFDVTFKFGTPYGVKNGNVTVTPTYDATAAQTITVTGKAKDPNVWSEDFSGNAVPTGWDAGANWTITNGVAKAAYQYGSTTYLTTPTLTVSDATDEMTFDYKRNNAKIVIQKKQGSGDWESLVSLPSSYYETDSDWQTYTITGLEAGDYQFRFANDDYDLDNFEGFQLKAAAAHEATVKTLTIPATGNQYVSYTASVNVKVTGTNDEEITAKFFIGNTQYGSDVVKTVNSDNTETFEVTFTPEVAVSGDAYFTIESADIAAFETAKTAVTIAEATVVDETMATTLTNGNAASVVVNYTAKAGWNTITMPFKPSNDFFTTVFGDGYKVYELKGFNQNQLNFGECTYFAAGYAYIVYSTTPGSSTVYLQNVSIDATPNYDQYTDSESGTTVKFYGSYTPRVAGEMTGLYGVTGDGAIAKGSATATMKGYRGYFEFSEPVSNVRIVLPGGEVLTGIDAANILGNSETVYNLQGQRVNAAQKGVYIIGGKKVVK